MKKLTVVLVLVLIVSITMNTMRACPTCVGRLELDTPAFFTNEYDEYHQTNDDDSDTCDTENEDQA